MLSDEELEITTTPPPIASVLFTTYMMGGETSTTVVLVLFEVCVVLLVELSAEAVQVSLEMLGYVDIVSDTLSGIGGCQISGGGTVELSGGTAPEVLLDKSIDASGIGTIVLS